MFTQGMKEVDVWALLCHCLMFARAIWLLLASPSSNQSVTRRSANECHSILPTLVAIS
jgi:hypothetical protein